MSQSQEEFLAGIWEPLHSVFIDSAKDPLIVFTRFSLSCKAAQSIALRSIRKLDFSYLVWHSLPTPRILVRGETFRNFCLRAVSTEQDALTQWGRQRLNSFILNSDKLINLRSLDLSGSWIDPQHSPVACAKLAQLELERLNIICCNWLELAALKSLFEKTPLAKSLLSLRFGGVNSISETLPLLSNNCHNLRELDWCPRHRMSAPETKSDELQLMQRLADSCKSLWSLSIFTYMAAGAEWVPLFQRRLRLVNWYGHRYHNDAHDNYVVCALKHGIEIQNIFWEARVTASPLSRYAPIIVNRLTQPLFASYPFKMSELEAHLESVRQYAKVPPVSEIDWNALPAPGITPSLYAATQINMQTYDVKIDILTHAADHYFCGVNFLSAQALTFSRRGHVLLYLFNLDYALRSWLYNLGALNQTLLMMAPGQFRQRLLRDFLELAESIGADVNQQDMFGYSVLHYAALAKPAPKAWKALLDAGANPFLLSWGGTKSTPYEILISNQPHSSSLAVALRTIPAHELDRFLEARPDLRLLTLIVSNNDAPLRKYLDPLEGKEGAWTSGFVTQIVQRANGVYPLLIAACFKGSKTLPTLLSSLSIMKLLGINDERSVASKKARGTALHYASANGLVECVRLLIAAGADVNHTAPKYGRQTPLISACSTVVGAPCVPLLLEHMVNNAESLNYAPEPQKYTALHWAATWPKSCGPIFKMLLDTYSINPTAKDYTGRTPRDWAVGNPFRDSETGWLLTYFQDIA